MFRQMYASELVSALRYCHEPVELSGLMRAAAEPSLLIIFTAISDTSRTAADFLNIATKRNAMNLSEEVTALKDVLVRAQELEDRVKQIASCLPHIFTFECSKRVQTLANAPRWLQRALRDRRGPETSHKKYLHINVANAWNWMRYCHIRALELQVLISRR